MDTLVVTKRSQLTDIADAIRAKTGKSDEIALNDMPNEINEIGGGNKGFCYVDTLCRTPQIIQNDIHINTTINIEAKQKSALNPLIDICMLDGSNLGTGGNQYAASYSGGSFSNGMFTITGNGYLTIPTPMTATVTPWTIAFTINNCIVSSSNTYGRIARGSNDVPSIFYTKSVDKFQAKMAYGSANANTNGLTVVDTSQVEVLDSGACLFTFDKTVPNTFIFRNDGEYISLWINGIEYMRETINNYAETKYATTFSIGDNAGAGYNMYQLRCSMLKVWDRALTQEEISIVTL